MNPVSKADKRNKFLAVFERIREELVIRGYARRRCGMVQQGEWLHEVHEL
jgi:hypothetical protein